MFTFDAENMRANPAAQPSGHTTITIQSLITQTDASGQATRLAAPVIVS